MKKSILLFALIVLLFVSVANSQTAVGYDPVSNLFYTVSNQFRFFEYITVWDDTLFADVLDTSGVIYLGSGDKFLIETYTSVIGDDSAGDFELRFYSLDDQNRFMFKTGSGAADSIFVTFSPIDSGRISYRDVSSQLQVHDKVRFTLKKIGTNIGSDTMLVRIRIAKKK